MNQLKSNDITYIALDMDGTILDARYRIDERVVKALAATRATGKKVIISTGRVYSSVLKNSEALGRVDGYVCSNGADVRLGTGETVLNLAMEPELGSELIKLSRRHNSHFHGFVGETWYFERELPYTEYYRKRSGLEGVQISFDNSSPPRFAKCLFLDEHELLEPIRRDLERTLGDRVQVMYSSPNMLEVVTKGVSKSFGLAACVERLGGTLSKTIAFGDADNDEDMILAAGIGVAMGNAHDELKAKADIVAKSVDEAGVAYFLDDFFGLGLFGG